MAITRQSLKGYYRTTPLWPRLLVVPEFNLLYMKNPKAGCSTIELWLNRMHTGEHDWTPAEGELRIARRVPRVKDLGFERVAGILRGGGYRFTFVRHPLRRLESAYRDKLTREGPYRPMIQETLGLPADPMAEVTFDQFMAALEQQDPVDGMNPHWRPQNINLMHPVVEYDRVGHLETFDADLAQIRAEAGLPDIRLEVRNASRRTETGSAFDGRPDLVRRAEAIYADDFEIYGY